MERVKEIQRRANRSGERESLLRVVVWSEGRDDLEVQRLCDS